MLCECLRLTSHTLNEYDDDDDDDDDDVVPEALFLNSQITTLLSQLGLPSSAFFSLLGEEIRPLIFAFFEPDEAVKLIADRHRHLTQILSKCPNVLREPLIIDILKEMLLEKLGKRAHHAYFNALLIVRMFETVAIYAVL